jgi:hypothetical protein
MLPVSGHPSCWAAGRRTYWESRSGRPTVSTNSDGWEVGRYAAVHAIEDKDEFPFLTLG